MSCHYIQICNGTKMMIPVNTIEEYRRIRDSEHNRKAEKRNLAQINYSCLPNDDGTLKGAKRMSRSVGMDIDLDNTQPDYEKRIEEITAKILECRERLGLLMLEKSINKGLHLVFRRKTELTQEQNLIWASMMIGVDYDKGAKDITRIFYTPPTDRLLYCDRELFDNSEPKTTDAPEPTPLSALFQKEPSAASDAGMTEEDKAPDTTAQPCCEEEATDATLLAFDRCAELAGLDCMRLDSKGSRHANLLAILSEGLPKLVTKPQLLAAVAKRMPTYWQCEECTKLVDYFYEKYSADRGYMTKKLREINAEVQKIPEAGEASDNEVMEALTEDYDPPAPPENLPPIMNLLVSNYDEKFRSMLLLSALPILSAHASHYRCVYLNGKMIGPQQYVAVIGSSGSGKGNCTHLFQTMVRHTLQDNDSKEWQKVKENAELRDKQANAKVRPPKYHPRLRLFETTSKSSILELQTNLGANGMLLGYFSEVDGLSSMSRAAYSDISVLLRKGWDGDMHRQFYMSDATCNTYTQMSISILMAGTPKAMLERMFSDSNCEGGLMQRCIPVLVPKGERTFRPPVVNCLDSEQAKQRDEMLVSLYEKDLSLGEETKLLQMPKIRRMIGTWFDELEQRYSDGMLTEAEADLSHRCGEFIMRAAIPLVALYGKETPEIMDFCRWVGDIAHYNICRIFGGRVQKNLEESETLIHSSVDGRKTAEPLLNQLPDVFTSKQFSEMRKKNGQSENVRAILSLYCKNGKIKRINRGVFEKVK